MVAKLKLVQLHVWLQGYRRNDGWYATSGGPRHHCIVYEKLIRSCCDPVAGLVEVPCVKRNGFYAVHAITASEMA